ncbi:glutamate cyclase domain-containing protein [Nakamurella sp. PAMC28650]|uniref:glutamate cyclase domain-containing protein n=1 Tax=Nakamurella sp. PAMC28650 TaxID=2762325 RepID=UPI00164D925F|nr:glutamate cyclase domain-containing protein [Nakamurella sp. PAMC28650]QNK82716.1 DUF4392 domain-containing protein [Nakamurella sp. PAMC28650]
MQDIVGRTVRRDISRLAAFADGNLEAAARSIAEHPRPHIGVVCGFFVRHAEPPSPETDGLNGMGHLAAAFTEVGVPVTVITDAPCAKAVWAVTRVLPHPVNLEIVDVSASSVRRLRGQLEAHDHPLTHLVAIERCSLAADGRAHREHGWDISKDTAPLDYLFEDGNWHRSWTTIGAGDGGNEIGMGNLPKDIIEADIPHGSLVAARTGADHLLVSGVANWGAYALVTAVAALRPELASRLLAHFDGATEKMMLDAAVAVGQAVDDSRADRPGQLQMTIDRLPLEDHVAVLEALRATLPQTSPTVRSWADSYA